MKRRGGAFALRVTCFAVLALVSLARPSRAQFEDTLATDSLAADTAKSTERYLQAMEQAEVRVPVMPRLPAPGPRPALTRVVFTRDSIDWMSGATVSDLLLQVPGVYVWRGGFTGRPEQVDFEGRGASSVEYYLDGVPYVAQGVDSIAVDPSLFSISFLERVEVERWPGVLKVHLFTQRHDRLAPRSRVGIARGDREFARYEGDLERRFPSGIGFGVAADYLNSPTASGVTSDYSNTQVWGQGGYVPTRRFGVQYQLIRSRPKRQAFTVAGMTPSDTIGLGYTATRTDAQIRVALRSREDGTGSGLDLIYARSAWDGAGIDQQTNQIGGYASFRAPTFSVGASGFHRTRWTPLDIRGTVGWSPIAPFTANLEAVLQHHYGGRSSKYVALAGGLTPMRWRRAHRHGAAGGRGRGAVHSRRHLPTDPGLRGAARMEREAARRRGGLQPDVGVQSVRVRGLRRDSGAGSVVDRGLADRQRARGAALVAHAAELVQ